MVAVVLYVKDGCNIVVLRIDELAIVKEQYLKYFKKNVLMTV